jgi:hypothetical protein
VRTRTRATSIAIRSVSHEERPSDKLKK